jgi:hypothetical protein
MGHINQNKVAAVNKLLQNAPPIAPIHKSSTQVRDMREIREDVKRVAIIPMKDNTTQHHVRQHPNQSFEKQDASTNGRQIIIGYPQHNNLNVNGMREVSLAKSPIR